MQRLLKSHRKGVRGFAMTFTHTHTHTHTAAHFLQQLCQLDYNNSYLSEI